MSIIYDALKKLEKPNPENLEKDNKKNKKQSKLFYLTYILMVFMGFFIAKIVFDVLTKPPSPPAISTPVESKAFQELPVPVSSEERPLKVQTLPEEKPLPSLSLSGIFFDEKQAYAIINNQIVREGDIISGVKVVRILLNEVDLEFEGKSIELKTAR